MSRLESIAVMDSILFSTLQNDSIMGGAALQRHSIMAGAALQRDSILGGAALQRCDHVAYLPTALAAEVAP